ncbi:aldose epimerase family protein [Aquamicrobium sp. LC103]|uniref:aldose epimerase family protein n=1 Tax=Aquamicrobium sp. LC103 TaxID=1120658 RepID=UPI00063EAB06|nr:aldose epimerase family protein [Aquamicrobium sp. LC103]TKT79143.1 galactose mutarotase [Aquamicrobium sp. LC103]
MKPFGTLPDGTRVAGVTLTAGNLSAHVIGWGAALRDLRLRIDGTDRRLVLGFERLGDYVAHSPHFGATAGRYAGRIAGGTFVLDGVRHRLSLSAAGKHHVHGGFAGFGKRNWTLAEAGGDFARFTLLSRDGEEGYPGNLVADCSYRLAPRCLRVTMEARTDRPTVVNLLHHSYFNLDGEGRIDGHRLRIPAERMVEVDSEGLPTGRYMPPSPPFDFMAPRHLDPDTRYDASYLLPDGEGMKLAAELGSSAGDLRMEVWTTEPGLHLYDGGKISVPVNGLDDIRYGPRSGLCLEPTRFSNAPNAEGFPDTVLRPGGIYRQITEFRFEGDPR